MKVWVCPSCGERNAVDSTECASCGRWASLFDLERTIDVADPGEPSDEIDYEPAPEPGDVSYETDEPVTVELEPVTIDEPSPPTPLEIEHPRADDAVPKGGWSLPGWLIPAGIVIFIAVRALLENL